MYSTKIQIKFLYDHFYTLSLGIESFLVSSGSVLKPLWLGPTIFKIKIIEKPEKNKVNPEIVSAYSMKLRDRLI